ncbi:hypothetical protein [Sphingomonas sp. SRS2]|uniref:hypothetical protein n=1 Tax=Sphingomonas sp. SRS2 TaxID=133190 RepID=UPI0006184D9B|nr:hypothetical protein [Sphingomonas sp. SRS2]KKC24857.1 hypothetical protein WP12_16605 [Sphingomonas sp. SRS2]
MKKITLNTADRKLVDGNWIFADAGETLVVGGDTTTERAALLVERGGAVRADPLDHDDNGRKGGSKPRQPRPPVDVADTAELQPRDLAEGEMLEDASASLGLTGEQITVDQLAPSDAK